MKLALAVGIAAAGLAFSALAHEMPRMDDNGDGYLTRAEASAAAERIFRDLDSNNDNRLDSADHPSEQVFEFRMDGPGDHAGHPEVHVRREAGEHSEQHIERHVIVRRNGEETELESDEMAPLPPIPPVPPHPPMFMMLIGNNEEADLNNDGALSLEEFRAQQLRFFDAGDANGDGRVRFTPPPEPPEPPLPPEPPHAPEPPAPPRHR